MAHVIDQTYGRNRDLGQITDPNLLAYYAGIGYTIDGTSTGPPTTPPNPPAIVVPGVWAPSGASDGDLLTVEHGQVVAAPPTGAGVAALTATAVKTTAYTAAADQLIPVDATSGAVTVTLPATPADKTRVTVKKIDTSANAVTIARGGSDVFNKAGGSTSLTLPWLNEAVTVHYAAATGIWYVVADDLPKTALDSNYAAVSPTLAPPTVYAHRGLGDNWNGYANGPLGGIEETEYSVDAAFAAGAQGVMVHAQVISDGTVVLMHDSTVTRTTTSTGNTAEYDIGSWRMLTCNTTQPGFGVTLPVTVQPGLLRPILAKWGGKKHLTVEIVTTASRTAILSMVQEFNLVNAVSILSFRVADCIAAAAIGCDVIWCPPNLGQTGSDAATLAASGAWAAGKTKRVGINYQPTNTVSVTTTNTSAAVTAASGLSAVDGWNVRGTGIPFGTTFTATSDTTGTLSANATATGTATLSFWPTRAQMVSYIGTLVSAGLEVMAYIVNCRADKTWLTAAGVTRFTSGDPIYLVATAQMRQGASVIDPTSKGAWPHGVLLADPALPGAQAAGRGSIANGGQTLDKQLNTNEQHLVRGDVSFLGTVPATYTVRCDFSFATMPADTTRWLAVRLCATDDSPFSDSLTSGSGISNNGYLVIVRGNGQMQVFKNAVGQANAQLGATQTMSTVPTAGATFRLVVAVTATQLVVSVKDTAEATTYATVTITDSTARGGYVYVGKAESAATFSPVFKNLTAA